jgi:hypothetical protein
MFPIVGRHNSGLQLPFKLNAPGIPFDGRLYSNLIEML